MGNWCNPIFWELCIRCYLPIRSFYEYQDFAFFCNPNRGSRNQEKLKLIPASLEFGFCLSLILETNWLSGDLGNWLDSWLNWNSSGKKVGGRRNREMGRGHVFGRENEMKWWRSRAWLDCLGIDSEIVFRSPLLLNFFREIQKRGKGKKKATRFPFPEKEIQFSVQFCHFPLSDISVPNFRRPEAQDPNKISTLQQSKMISSFWSC